MIRQPTSISQTWWGGIGTRARRWPGHAPPFMRADPHCGRYRTRWSKGGLVRIFLASAAEAVMWSEGGWRESTARLAHDASRLPCTSCCLLR